MADPSDNAYILQAILGTGLADQPTTWNTGATGQQTNPVGGQLPTMPNPLSLNPTHAGTMQQLGGITQPNPQFSNYQNPIRHSIGRDSWSSGIGLDHQSILENLGLGRPR